MYSLCMCTYCKCACEVCQMCLSAPFCYTWLFLFSVFIQFSFSFLSWTAPLPIPSLFLCPSLFPPLSSPDFHSLEEHSAMYLMVPKPLDSFNQLRVKGKGLKQKVLHASCEWYALEMVNKLWTLNCTLKCFKLQDSLCSELPEVSLQF